jgi:hypothetical protein
MTRPAVVLIYVLGRYPADSWVGVEDVYAGVKPYWGTLRRRDGSEYHGDFRRAVAASLANNPTVAIFKREGKDKNTWMLTRAGRDKHAMLKGDAEVVPGELHPHCNGQNLGRSVWSIAMSMRPPD